MIDHSQHRNNKPMISVVLGSYNRLSYIRYTIGTIRDELAGIGFKTEIIVVDGGSHDGTTEWLLSQKDIITIVQHNRGQWMGRNIVRRSWGYFMNLAFKSAQGTYICMLSDDCLVYPGAIKNALTLAENEREKGVPVGACAFYFTNLPDQKEFAVNYTINNTLMINHGLFLKDALEKIGYIDEENFRFYHADDDLALRLAEEGYKIIDSKESYIEHFLHANIKLREQVYTTERDDYKALISKWGAKFNIDENTEIHKSLSQNIALQHPNMPVFYKLYKKELRRLRVNRFIKHLLYKSRKGFKNFLMFFYYAFRYFADCVVLLFSDRKKLRQKIHRTLNK